jgi:fumarate hydratase subunit beta
MQKVCFPFTQRLNLKLFDEIEIHGRIYCGRDAVLPKLVHLFHEGRLGELGIDLAGSVIFHTAVSPAGIGPTSSNKLEIEEAIEPLSAAGVKVHLGKGAIKPETVAAMATHQAYFAVTPPTSALFSSRIVSQRLVAFSELGMEAFYELEVAGIPAIIAASNGESIF